MSFIIELYQTITESEINSMPQRRRMATISIISSSRNDVRRELSDRNNPMQSSIIKLLTELEANNMTSDTEPLIK